MKRPRIAWRSISVVVLLMALLQLGDFRSGPAVAASSSVMNSRLPTALPLPPASNGPKCARDYYADSNTTKVATAEFRGDRRPVVYVHGFSSNAEIWSSGDDPAGKLQRQTDGRIQNFLYDYSADSVRWANNDKIAACLGQYISEIGESYKKVGGDGKVLVVAHSMGGLATLYSSSSTFAQYPSGAYLGGIVTFDTPYLGSLWGSQAVATYLIEGKQAFFNQQLLPMPTSDAGHCLAPHANGKNIPLPCLQPLPPALPAGVPLTTIQGNITVTRKVLGIAQYEIPLNSDGIVSVDSARGYRDMFAKDPGSANIDTSKVVNCSITTGDIVAAAKSGVGPTWWLRVGTGAAKAGGTLFGSLYDLTSDGWSQLFHAFDKNGTSGADRSADLNMLGTLAIANMKAPCSHTNIVRDQSALNKATEAMKNYLDALDIAGSMADPCKKSPCKVLKQINKLDTMVSLETRYFAEDTIIYVIARGKNRLTYYEIPEREYFEGPETLTCEEASSVCIVTTRSGLRLVRGYVFRLSASTLIGPVQVLEATDRIGFWPSNGHLIVGTQNQADDGKINAAASRYFETWIAPDESGTFVSTGCTEWDPAEPLTSPATKPCPNSSAEGDLGLTQPIRNLSCDGRFIAILASATTPNAYKQDVNNSLIAHRGAEYLRTKSSCGSLTQQSGTGNEIYAVYFGPFSTQAEACSRSTTGQVRRLDGSAPAAATLTC
jgi:pimeloyl-ACP methyl ester carboxylesterase